ncbi:MucR family transcriptional regulator [Tepidicaulis sp. LMO-SS28]|uniref:MucR family transcriptional regulator n=1 Tax=Tepidicaulis sp. LMO-SS28 TaxID=3447455 RepID=UPI003EE0BE24
MADKADLIDMTAGIVSAYVGNNPVSVADLPQVINQVYQALEGAAADVASPSAAAPLPACPVEESVTPDFIVCLEDGKKFKSLKRHIRTHYNLSPEEYRVKWGLPADYPMVAPNYAKARSKLAKRMGLGQKSSGRPRGKRQTG